MPHNQAQEGYSPQLNIKNRNTSSEMKKCTMCCKFITSGMTWRGEATFLTSIGFAKNVNGPSPTQFAKYCHGNRAESSTTI